VTASTTAAITATRHRHEKGRVIPALSLLLQRHLFENVFAENLERYATVSENDIIDKNPAIIFLSSEPYPFKQKHIIELQNLLPKAKIILVDGEMFSWYGSRLRFSANYFKELLNQLSN
jgi:ABC-type Fe3+-hydroxamate transport system substrate-binding protein